MKYATLEQLAARFDAFLIDQFGVILDGKGAIDGTPDALWQLAETGKPIIFLSNSGRRSAPNEARLTGLGFPRGCYLTVLSSGEVAFAELSRRIGDDIAAGTPVWAHGRNGDTSHTDGLDLTCADSPGEAGLIVLAGCRPQERDLDGYAELLRPAAARGIEMICTNPDLEMLTPAGKSFGPGRVAEIYEEFGGPVRWIGKPHREVYEEAFRCLPGVPPERILCIGDSPAHDVAGGRGAGLATALVRTGIYAGLSEPGLLALCARLNATPDFLLPRFAFAAEDASCPSPSR